MKTKVERQRICNFCRRIGSIDFVPGDDRVLNTVMEELNKFFKGCSFSGTGRLVIGLADSETIRALPETDSFAIHKVDPKDDGFEICTVGDSFVVAGANPRGVLYGIYELEDRILAGDVEGISVFIVPAFRKRSDALGHYHNKETYNFDNDPIDEKKAEYLARLRINQFCACFDRCKFGNSLSEFVHSDIFPFQREPMPEAVATLKNSSYILSKYGIDFHMMLWEPALPRFFAPVESYPQEAIGKVYKPHCVEGNRVEYTLCVNNSLVQQHYRNIVPKFIREYPDVKGFFLYNLDGTSWLCTPELCPTCAETLVDSDPSGHNPWETQSTLVTLLAEAAHSQDPDFAINFWGTVHFHGEAVANMYNTAKGYDVLTTACMGLDHDIFVTHLGEPVFEVAETIRAAKAHGKPSCIYYAYNKLEAVQAGLPSPFATAEALKLFHRWGFDDVIEVTGPTPCMNQITALTMRQFLSQPDTDTESWLRELADKQFGVAAGPKMYEAWKHIHNGFSVWREYGASPLTGSHPLRLGLQSDTPGTLSILPGVENILEYCYLDILSNGEPFRREDFARNLTPEFIERFIHMESHFAKAETATKAAMDVADNEPVGISYYDGAFEGIGRHTRWEFARLNWCSTRMTHSMICQNLNVLKAGALLRTMRDTPDTKAALYPKYLRLLEEDRQLLSEYVAMLEEFMVMRPCLPMTGMCENELQMYADNAQWRIAMIDTYLSNNQ